MSEIANINVRIDKEDKDDFTALCEKLGLSISTAINMFVKQSVRDNRLPLSLSADSQHKKTVSAIMAAERNEGLSRTFDTVDELMEALNAKD